MSIEVIIQCHLIVWTVACACAFTFYYCSDDRKNPECDDQLHCPSGLMCCNLPLFGFVMCGFSGAALMSVGVTAYKSNNVAALACFLAVFKSMLMIVNFDIKKYHTVHMISLFTLIVTTTAFFVVADITSAFFLTIYYAATALFVFIMFLNFVYIGWVAPFMSLQALAEIAWLDVVVGGVIVYAVSDGSIS